MDWLRSAVDAIRGGGSCVLVTVADTRGSAPREVGAKMVVTTDGCAGTIGGGQLEFSSTEVARELLADPRGGRARLERFALGPSLGQCCGGVADLLFERIDDSAQTWLKPLHDLDRRGTPAVLVTAHHALIGTAQLVVSTDEVYGEFDSPVLHQRVAEIARRLLEEGGAAHLKVLPIPQVGDASVLFEPMHTADFHVVLFGAGHVGTSLIQVLAGLPCTVTWVDGRRQRFPSAVPANVNVALSDDPLFEVDDAPRDSFFLIMTHSHPLDQSICERVLRRADFRYCGLIGSRSKRRNFEKRLRAQGINAQSLARMTCPIGVEGVAGKRPAEIAVAVAAQLLQVHAGAVGETGTPGYAHA